MSGKCGGCGIKLQTHITGRQKSSKGEVCDDCYFKELGDHIEKHPIGRPKGMSNQDQNLRKQLEEARERAECASTWWELVTKLHHLLGIEYHTTTDELVSIVRSRLNCGVESQAEAAAMRDWIQKILRLAQNQKVMGDKEFLEGLKLSQTEGIVCSNKAARAFLDRLRKAEDRADFAEAALKQAVEATEQTQTALAEEEELHDWIVRNENAWTETLVKQAALTEKAERECDKLQERVNSMAENIYGMPNECKFLDAETCPHVKKIEIQRDEALVYPAKRSCDGALAETLRGFERGLAEAGIKDLNIGHGIAHLVQERDEARQQHKHAEGELETVIEHLYQKELRATTLKDRVQELEIEKKHFETEHFPWESCIYSDRKSRDCTKGHDQCDFLCDDYLGEQTQRIKELEVENARLKADPKGSLAERSECAFKRAEESQGSLESLLDKVKDAGDVPPSESNKPLSSLRVVVPTCSCGRKATWSEEICGFFCHSCGKGVAV